MPGLIFALLAILPLTQQNEPQINPCGVQLSARRISMPYSGLHRTIADSEPTTLLVYCPQDAETPDESTWDSEATELLEEVGHTIVVTSDADSFLAAASTGEFEVLMMKIGEARRLKAEIATAAPDAVVLPILYLAPRSERKAAEQEFGRALAFPIVARGLPLCHR